MKNKISNLNIFLFILLLFSMGYSSLNLNTDTMFLVSVFMFLNCVVNSIHLFKLKPTIIFVVLATSIGWFAEFAGENYGWFFGGYDFTDALGYKVGGVPFVIPLMWFNLCYIGLILSFLIQERRPFKQISSFRDLFFAAILGAILVTAYDLAADPYMVYVVKAWIMEKTDGWWFGETVQGFAGWLIISFTIISSFLAYMKTQNWALPENYKPLNAFVPVLIYFCWMVFQIIYGYPYETRTISAFAMGTPLLILLLGMKHWNNFK
jgi:uncharacterized membrane protein